MKKTKIGKGYYQNGYGRGFKPNVCVWEINGKAYVKDSVNKPYETDLVGYVMVNPLRHSSKITFAEIGLIKEHENL